MSARYRHTSSTFEGTQVVFNSSQQAARAVKSSVWCLAGASSRCPPGSTSLGCVALLPGAAAANAAACATNASCTGLRCLADRHLHKTALQRRDAEGAVHGLIARAVMHMGRMVAASAWAVFQTRACWDGPRASHSPASTDACVQWH